MKRLIATTAAAATAAVTLSALPVAAQETESSQVYVVHGVPGLEVDVYVNDALTLSGFDPKDIAGPLTLDAADYQIEIFGAKADPEESADARISGGDTVAIDETETVPGGANVSVVAHLDATGTPIITPFVNDVSSTGSQGRVSIRHAAEAPSVDIVAGGAAVGNLVDIENGDQEDIDLPAGAYATGIAATGTTDVIFDAPVEFGPGEQLAVYAIGQLDDGAGGSTFDLIVQSFDGLVLAPEYRDTTGIPASIARIYQAMLDRSPDAAGFAYWVELREESLTAGDIVFNFNASEEFDLRFADIKDGTDAEWIDFLYSNVLGREADDEGKTYWLGLLEDGTVADRFELVIYFADSQEFQNVTATS